MNYQLIGLGALVSMTGVFVITLLVFCFQEWLCQRRKARLKHRTKVTVSQNRE